MPTLFTQEKMRALLDHIADGKSMAKATALAYGSRSKIGWCHIRNSKREKDAGIDPSECRYFVHDWPEANESHHLCDAYQMALQISKLNFHMEVLQEVRESTRPVIEGGRVMYEIDHEAMALYEGDADIARLCGVHDPFYRHDENGARIPLRVRDRTSAALTIKALQAINPEQWDRPQQIDVTKKIQAVLTLGGEKPQPSAMRMSMEERLAFIRAHPDRATAKPDLRVGPVYTGDGKSAAGDPPEHVSNQMGDDAAKPLPPEPPRALPPPVSYARPRPNNNLDRQDAPNKGAPPPGGFKIS
jgi:hypothetical protein